MIKQIVLVLVLAISVPIAATAHDDMGLLDEPVKLSNYKLRLHDGSRTKLHKFTRGKITAVQMVFTTCSSICPIQGATFGYLAEDLDDEELPFQLLSISIDADYDTPERLAEWRGQFYDGPGWTLAVTDFVSTLELTDELMASKYGGLIGDNPVPRVAGDRPSETDHHGSIVFFIGPDSRIIYRSFDFPDVDQLRQILDLVETEYLG